MITTWNIQCDMDENQHTENAYSNSSINSSFQTQTKKKNSLRISLQSLIYNIN